VNAGKAPPGFYVEVYVEVRLGDGTRVERFTWATPQGMSGALHKAPGWAREDLRARKVKGRSKIVGILVDAQLVRGEYRRQPE